MWARLANTALGVWLMAAPDVLRYGDPAQTNDRIFGPIAAALAIVAIWGVTRSLRWVNLLIGVWLVVAPWVLGYGQTPLLNSSAVGLLMALFALARGEVAERYGGWRAVLIGRFESEGQRN